MAPPARDIVKLAEPEPAAPAIVTPPPPPPVPLFGPAAEPGDALGLEPVFGRLAELVLHRRTGTPLAIGVLGEPGSGKSFALARILARLRDLAAAAAKVPASPFVSRVHVEAIDAADLVGDPATALVGRLHAGLRGAYPDLAREIAQSARDPHVAHRDATEKLDEARRRLDAERRALDDAGSRRARLVETVLHETSGSGVDSYARANRARLESRFAGFGIAGDAVRQYKDLVGSVVGSGGHAGLATRALWAYKGQGKLLVAALVLVALGIGLGIAIDDKDAWLGALRGGPQAGAASANWMQAHIGLLASARSAAFAGAVLCVLANLWRAFAFLKPIRRGAALLEGDLDGRRRDLDGLYAHQTKRVDTLEADVERWTRQVGEAERRLGGSAVRADPSPFEAAGGATQARAALAVLAQAIAKGGSGRGPAAPQRIVLALDHLESVTPDRARDILDALHRAAPAGLVALVAVDPLRLAAPAGAIERWIDVPLRLDGVGGAGASGMVSRLLGREPALAAPAPDASVSLLDTPIEEAEADMLAAVAPLAAASPRALRRFVDLYRLARLEGDAPRGALALAVALRLGGSAEEREHVKQASGAASTILPADASPRLGAAWEAAASHDSGLSEAAIASATRQAVRHAFPEGLRRSDGALTAA